MTTSTADHKVMLTEDCQHINAEEKTHQLQKKKKRKAQFTARDHKLLK